MRPVLVLAVLVACGGGHAKPDASGDGPALALDAPADAAVDIAIDADPDNPPTLFDTGLCVDRACTQIAAGISEYTPHFGLWADAASKHRWMQLPAGTQIDTTDPDHWVFPVGTKFWKEFSAEDAGGNDVRVETRFIKKLADTGGANDWFYVAYQWNDAQTDTTAQPFGVMNANGTQHDIPARFQCKQCHEGISSRILGFGAIQLDVVATAGQIGLDEVIASGWLTQAPPGAAVPHYPLPGTGTSAGDAIGYLHANCGHCHNPQSPVYTGGEMITMDLRLSVGALGALSETGAYQSAVDHDATLPIGGLTKRIVTDMPDQSILIYRFEAAPGTAPHMPLIGSEVIDQAADTTLRDWITHIQ